VTYPTKDWWEPKCKLGADGDYWILNYFERGLCILEDSEELRKLCRIDD
jgi:hypothetical protein